MDTGQIKDFSVEKREKIKEISAEKAEVVREKTREVTREVKERAKRENWYTIPNAISLSRIISGKFIIRNRQLPKISDLL